MSETETHKGKLTLLYRGSLSVESLARDLCIERGIKQHEWETTWTEAFTNNIQDMVLVSDQFYFIHDEDHGGDDDIFVAEKENDGSISYMVRYYNGCCSFPEALQEAMRKCNVKGDEE